MKVFVNAGHCIGEDSGACGFGLEEARVTREICDILIQKLKDNNYVIDFMQSNNLCGEDGQEYAESICCRANLSSANIAISVHCNSFNTFARGTEVFCGGYKSMRLAEAVQDELVYALNTRDRGVKDGLHYAFIKYTTMPAILIEVAFIDNEEDNKILAEKKEEIAEAICKGINKFYNGY